MNTSSFASKPTFWSLDILKLFLAVIVSLRHVAQVFFPANSLFHTITVNLISPLAVPTFFLISGFLFYQKQVSVDRLLHQVKRICILYLCWTVIYLPFRVLNFITNGVSLSKQLLLFVQEFLFMGSHYHLWFLPSLAFAILFVWFLERTIKNNRIQLCAVMLLFAVGVTAENYAALLPDLVKRMISAYSQVFLTTRNGLFFGAVFVWLGKEFAQKGCAYRKVSFKQCGACLLLFGLFGILENIFMTRTQEGKVVNMFFFAVPLVILVFVVAMKVNFTVEMNYNTSAVRKASTFIFCWHPFVISVVSNISEHVILITPVLSACIVMCLLGASTYLFLKLIHRIKVLTYLV